MCNDLLLISFSILSEGHRASHETVQEHGTLIVISLYLLLRIEITQLTIVAFQRLVQAVTIVQAARIKVRPATTTLKLTRTYAYARTRTHNAMHTCTY